MEAHDAVVLGPREELAGDHSAFGVARVDDALVRVEGRRCGRVREASAEAQARADVGAHAQDFERIGCDRELHGAEAGDLGGDHDAFAPGFEVREELGVAGDPCARLGMGEDVLVAVVLGARVTQQAPQGASVLLGQCDEAQGVEVRFAARGPGHALAELAQGGGDEGVERDEIEAGRDGAQMSIDAVRCEGTRAFEVLAQASRDGVGPARGAHRGEIRGQVA